jgi:nitroreductase
MPLVEAMRTQRAVRRLHTDPVDLDLIYELLELSLKAPTSSNSQDWVYIVVTDQAQKERLGRLYVKWFPKLEPLYNRGATDQELRAAKPGRWQAEHFDELPVFVVPCYRSNLQHRAIGWPRISVTSYYGSVYPAVQNLLLACRAVGLGASLQTLPVAVTPVAKRVLGLPRGLTRLHRPDRLGEGQVQADGAPRSIEDVVHIDRYGNQPPRPSRPTGDTPRSDPR